MPDDRSKDFNNGDLRLLFQRAAACVLVIDAVDLYTNPDHPVVQDMNYAYAASCHKRLLKPIQDFATAIRARAEPIWVAHALRARHPSTQEVIYDIDAEAALETFYGVTPDPNDFQLAKWNFSAFDGTKLHPYLQKKNIRTVMLTGFLTSACIMSTAISGKNLGYDMIVLEDLVGDADLDQMEPDRRDQITYRLRRDAIIAHSRDILNLNL